MALFIIACFLVIGAALVLELTSEQGVLEVSPVVWLAVVAILGIWLCCLGGLVQM